MKEKTKWNLIAAGLAAAGLSFWGLVWALTWIAYDLIY